MNGANPSYSLEMIENVGLLLFASLLALNIGYVIYVVRAGCNDKKRHKAW